MKVQRPSPSSPGPGEKESGKSPDVVQHLTGERVEDKICEGYSMHKNTGHTDQPLFHFGKSVEQVDAMGTVWLNLRKPLMTSPKGDGGNMAGCQLS